jgi:hypothetical protein
VRRGLLRWSAMTSFQFAQLMFVTQSVLIGAAVSLTSQAFSADGGDRLSGIASVMTNRQVRKPPAASRCARRR